MLAAYHSRVFRRLWRKPRSQQWWMDVDSNRYGAQWWKENLRMNRDTFMILCSELRPYIQRERTRLREPVSVEQRVALTIWKLATNVEYRTISNLFGVGISTYSTIVVETCQVLADKLFKKYVHIPVGDMLKDVMKGVETCWGFPQAVGAIDGSHVPIIWPPESASDYYNRKGYYSIIMQGLVDLRG